MKKILFYFECTALTIRCIDLVIFLKKVHGFDVYFNTIDEHSKWIFANMHKFSDYKVWDGKNINDFEIIFYDLTTWESIKSPINEYARQFKNKMVCINYEDGYSFIDYRIDDYTKDKTILFINNSLFKDKDLYSNNIKNKLFLTTSYITNSQLFKSKSINIDSKKRKIYFTGSLTGNATRLSNYNDSEKYFRFNLVQKIYNLNKYEHHLKFLNYDPSYKDFFEKNIPDYLKENTYFNTDVYAQKMIESMFCITVKGNSLPTNRLHESQAAGCISITNNFDEVEIYGVGINNKTFIEINIDLSDVEEKIDYCINNIDFARNIMYNSRKNWETYNMLDEEGLYSPVTQKYHTDAFKKYGLI